MKKIITSILGLSLSLVVMAGNPTEAKKMKVDTKVSNLEWVAKKVSGEHNGNLSVKSGEIAVNNGMITGGNIIFDMNTITVEDLKDPEWNAKLKGHLMSPDFFDVSNHNTATLKINKVTKGDKENEYIVSGELTIKGITKPIEFPATIVMEEGKLVAIGEAEVDRTKYDIKYGSGQFFEGLGDKMIYDNFTVKFKLGAK